MLLHAAEESGAAARVGVAAVHEAVEVDVLKLVLAGYVAEGEEVLQRGVNAAGGGQAHEVDGHIVGAGVAEGTLDFGIVEDGPRLYGPVDFHQVLIYDASGADVEVANFGIAHLAVGEADVLAAGVELRVGIAGVE